jgi:uncharacterized membrane protein YgcG
MRALRLLLAAWLWVALATAWAQDVLPVPALTARVIGQTGTLDSAETLYCRSMLKRPFDLVLGAIEKGQL